MVDQRNDQTSIASSVASYAISASSAHAVTMQDIADRCRVSLITVSRALRQDPRVKAETSRAILDMAEELGYDPAVHLAARRLALRKHGLDVVNHVITILLSGESLQSGYFNYMFRGVLSASTAQGFALLTADVLSEAGEEAPLPIYTRGEVDGFIILGWTFHKLAAFFSHLDRISHGRRFPVVTLLEQQPNCSAVLVDDRGGAYAATDHLLELGHRHILHFWGPDPLLANSSLPVSKIGLDRADGCRQACLDRNLDPDHTLRVSFTSGRIPLSQRVVAQLNEMLDQHPEITAILLPNDYFINQVRDVLQYRGLRIPDDMSVVGYDDVEPYNNEQGHNILTSVAVPLEEVGRQAAKLLVDHVTGQQKDITCITLPTELKVRGTTAPPRR
ncbi:MAG: LacI family DNA-binding transcriptional regulator [Armatimonadota bacterium]